MGAADCVPGVSGGTVALVLGIYRRLVTAVSRVDGTLFAHLRRRDVAAAWGHLDGRFVLALLAGVMCGVLALTTLMRHLMETHYTLTFAAFFGLVAGSVLLVLGLVERWTWWRAALVLIGAAVAYRLVTLPLLEEPPVGPGYLFLCGAVAICAMILPGVSGAFLLVVLGVYEHVTEWPKRLLKGEVDDAMGLEAAGFFGGMVLGITLFSKLLRWLLGHYQAATLAVLAGAMAGSLRRLWPFVEPRPDGVTFKQWVPEAVVPDPSSHTLLAVLLMIAGAAAVLLLDRLSRVVSAEGDPGPGEEVDLPPGTGN